MAITKEELIKELNKDLEYEYSAAIQYVQHAAVITGAQFQSIQKELVVHANEELAHAIVLAEQIAYLGGVPTTNVEKVMVDPDSVKMLEQDLEGEKLAIRRYLKRMEQAEELKLFGLKRAVEDILAQEEEHERDVATALGL